ncbi:hypothetical protein ABW17_02195 [Mycobacterium nebraskense]|nr:hypothetical protein WU83_00165 [Mycobacterium nebraskense]KLO46670.1 hypothetical protein ABW17_02195 [Mycobacterium nebraskense]
MQHDDPVVVLVHIRERDPQRRTGERLGTVRTDYQASVCCSVVGGQRPAAGVALERAYPVRLHDGAGRLCGLQKNRFHIGMIEQPGLANLRADRKGSRRVHELEAMPPGRASILEKVQNT